MQAGDILSLVGVHIELSMIDDCCGEGCHVISPAWRGPWAFAVSLTWPWAWAWAWADGAWVWA